MQTQMHLTQSDHVWLAHLKTPIDSADRARLHLLQRHLSHPLDRRLVQTVLDKNPPPDIAPTKDRAADPDVARRLQAQREFGDARLKDIVGSHHPAPRQVFGMRELRRIGPTGSAGQSA